MAHVGKELRFRGVGQFRLGQRLAKPGTGLFVACDLVRKLAQDKVVLRGDFTGFRERLHMDRAAEVSGPAMNLHCGYQIDQRGAGTVLRSIQPHILMRLRDAQGHDAVDQQQQGPGDAETDKPGAEDTQCLHTQLIQTVEAGAKSRGISQQGDGECSPDAREQV